MSEVLDSLELSEAEKIVYRNLLVSGQLSFGELVVSSKLNKDSLEQTLAQLKNKGLVREVPGIPNRYASLLPVGTVKEKLDQSVESIEVLSREIDSSSKQTLENIQSTIEQASTKLQSVVAEKTQKVEEMFSRSVQDVGHTKTEVSEKLTNEAETRKLQMDGYLDKEKSDVSQQLTQSLEAIKNKSEINKEAINRKANEISDSVSLPEKNLEVDLSSLSSFPDEFATTVGEFHEDAKTVLGNQLTSVENTLNEAMTNFNLGIQKQLELTNHAVGVNDTFSGELKNTLSSKMHENQQVLESHEGNISKMQSELVTFYRQSSERLDQTTDSVKNFLDGSLETLRQSIAEQFGKLLQDNESIGNQGESWADTAAEQISQVTQTLESIFTDQLSKQEEALQETLRTQLEQIIQQMSQTISSSHSQLMQQISEEIESLKVMNETTLSKTKDQIKEKISASSGLLEQKRDETISELSAKTADLIDQLKQMQQQLSDSLDSLKETGTATLSNTLQEINQSKSNIEATKNALLQSIDDLLERQKNDLLQITSLLDQEKANFESSTNTLRQTLQETTKSSQTLLDDKVTSAISSVIESTNNLKESLTVSVIELNQSFKSSQGELIQQFRTLVDSARLDFEQFLETITEELSADQHGLKERLEQTMDALKQNLFELIENSRTLQEKLVNDIVTRMEFHANEIKQLGLASIGMVQEVLQQASGDQTSQIGMLLNQYSEKFKSASLQISHNTQALSNALEGVVTLIQATETPQIKTSYLVGKEAIVSYISDMLERVKSKMTVLVPSIAMIDEEKVLKLPRTTQLTIVSYIDEISDKDWIDRMHNATANVTLRTLQKSGIAGVLPDFIGAEREGEEILLGTIDEGNNDYVAIISSSEYFVKILGNIVISDYARGKSRQLQK